MLNAGAAIYAAGRAATLADGVQAAEAAVDRGDAAAALDAVAARTQALAEGAVA